VERLGLEAEGLRSELQTVGRLVDAGRVEAGRLKEEIEALRMKAAERSKEEDQRRKLQKAAESEVDRLRQAMEGMVVASDLAAAEEELVKAEKQVGPSRLASSRFHDQSGPLALAGGVFESVFPHTSRCPHHVMRSPCFVESREPTRSFLCPCHVPIVNDEVA
jgi:hypothetical protein